jgi:predicted RNA-binding Zn-ribbon protein involved in translation (DUF1610 family)
VAALIHCPACNSPLRIPDDTDAASFTCPRCQEDIPNRPEARRADRDDIRAGPVVRSERRFNEEDAPRRADEVGRPRSDPSLVSVVLSSVVLALALAGLFYLQFGAAFATDQSMTTRKQHSGVLVMLALLLVVAIPIAGVFVARGRANGSWVAGLVLTILGGIATFLLICMAGMVFMVSTCLEPCDSKSRQQQPPKQVAPNK